MSNNKVLAIVGFMAATILITWLILDNINKAQMITNLKKEIDSNENLTNEIKKQLKLLLQNNKDIDPKVANELAQIVALLEIKQELTAIVKLSKIIENLLKEMFKDDIQLNELAQKNGHKTPSFADYLEHAKNKNLINNEEFHLLSVMKIIRNKEAHEVQPQKEKTRIVAAFVAGVTLALSLCRMLKKKTIYTKKEKSS